MNKKLLSMMITKLKNKLTPQISSKSENGTVIKQCLCNHLIEKKIIEKEKNLIIY